MRIDYCFLGSFYGFILSTCLFFPVLLVELIPRTSNNYLYTETVCSIQNVTVNPYNCTLLSNYFCPKLGSSYPTCDSLISTNISGKCADTSVTCCATSHDFDTQGYVAWTKPTPQLAPKCNKMYRVAELHWITCYDFFVTIAYGEQMASEVLATCRTNDCINQSYELFRVDANFRCWMSQDGIITGIDPTQSLTWSIVGVVLASIGMVCTGIFLVYYSCPFRKYDFTHVEEK